MAKDHNKSIQKWIALSLVVLLGGILIYSLLPFTNAFFGAIILYVLFKRSYLWFNNKFNGKQGLAAATTILLILLIIIIPFALTATLLVGEIGNILQGSQELLQYLSTADELLPTVDIEGSLKDFISQADQFLQNALLSSLGGFSSAVITLTIMFFCLYYLFVNSEKMPKLLRSVTPFSKKNRDLLVKEFSNITYSVVISTGVIALLQGVLLAIGFLIFGIDGALFWGFITAIFSFLPVVGASIIWIPAGIILLLKQNFVAGIGILIWGVILSNVDNFIRPMLQRKVGEMHPLTSIIGVFIGLPLFGILGLIIGPLLLSYFFLTLKMFREEYLD